MISRGLGRAPRGERFLNVTLLLGQSDEPCTMKHRLFKHEVTSLENYKVSMQRATFDLGKVAEAGTSGEISRWREPGIIG